MTTDESVKKSPWLSIPASDYEAHMGPMGVDQDAVLNKFFKQVYSAVRPGRLAVFGCGTGNGFEHIERSITERVVGVDINGRYLEIARRRYGYLAQTIEFKCTDVYACDFESASFDMIHCPIIFEYVQIETLIEKIATCLAPQGTLSVVLQLSGTEDGVVSDTGRNSVKALEEAFRPVDPDKFVQLCLKAGFTKKDSRVIPLQHGKSFFTGVFEKA
ncbi:MAG TPA: class I SAM-dependent methyltransferase [Myxococcota bacterium]|nr:class I SAM-dependent methyltransferase [Myxococcota bacterium]